VRTGAEGRCRRPRPRNAAGVRGLAEPWKTSAKRGRYIQVHCSTGSDAALKVALLAMMAGLVGERSGLLVKGVTKDRIMTSPKASPAEHDARPRPTEEPRRQDVEIAVAVVIAPGRKYLSASFPSRGHEQHPRASSLRRPSGEEVIAIGR
jgi:hypothetical protein